MLAYIVRRVLYLIPVFIFVSLITFVLMHAVPGGPWDTASAKTLSPTVRKAIAAKYKLDEPLPQQYVEYLWNALHGDLGPSFSTSVPVATVISNGFPITAALGAGALAIALLVGIPL